MKFLYALSLLLLSFSVQAESSVPNAPKHPKTEHHDHAATTVDTRPAFNESLIAAQHDKESSPQSVQDIDSGLQLNEAAVEGLHHLSVINGGINLPKDTLITSTQK